MGERADAADDREHEEEERANLGAATVEGLRWIAIARPIIEVTLLGSMVVCARLIPPAEFGAFAIATLVSELALLLPGEGIGTALVQRRTVTRGHLQAGVALALIVAITLIGLALVASTFVIAPIFGDRAAQLVRLSTPGFLIVALGVVPFAILRRRLAFKLLNLLDMCTSVGRGLGAVVLALAGLEGEALILGGLVASVFTVAWAWHVTRPPLPRLRRQPTRELLEYGLPASLAAMSWVGFRNCDYAIVGARLGALQAGFYFRAYTLAVEYQKKVSLVMGQIGFPVLARASSPEHLSELRHQMIRVLTIVLFPLLAILAIVSPVLVPWLFGAQWTAAVVPTQVLAIGGAATLVMDGVGAALQASGRAKALLGFGVAHFAVYAASVFVLSGMGLTAVAIGAAVVHTGFLFFAYWLMLRPSPERALPAVWRDVAPALVSCGGLAALAVPASSLLHGAHAPAAAYLVAVGVIALVGYAATLRWLFPEAWRTMAVAADRVLPARRPAFVHRRVVAAAKTAA